MTATAIKHEWLTYREAAQRIFDLYGIKVNRSTIERWAKEGRHNVKLGTFAERNVVRADTLPKVITNDDSQ